MRNYYLIVSKKVNYRILFARSLDEKNLWLESHPGYKELETFSKISAQSLLGRCFNDPRSTGLLRGSVKMVLAV